MYSGVGFPLLSCNLNSFKYSLTCTWCLASHCSFFRSRHSSNRPRRRNHDSQICSGMPTTCSGQRPSQHHMGLGVWAHDLQKPSGGVRGLVIGDLLRPVVSRINLLCPPGREQGPSALINLSSTCQGSRSLNIADICRH